MALPSIGAVPQPPDIFSPVDCAGSSVPGRARLHGSKRHSGHLFSYQNKERMAMIEKGLNPADLKGFSISEMFKMGPMNS